MFCRNCYPKLVKMTKRGGKAVVFCPAAKFFLRWPSKSVIISKHSYSMSVLPTTKSAGVLELADETDSKSVGGNTVWVRPPSPAPIVPKWFLPLRYFLFCAAWPDINRRCLPRCLPIFSAPGYPFTAYYDPARTPDSAGKPRQISVWGGTAQCHPPAAVKNRCAAVRSIFENPPCLAARGIFLRCAFSNQAILLFRIASVFRCLLKRKRMRCTIPFTQIDISSILCYDVFEYASTEFTKEQSPCRFPNTTKCIVPF